MLGSFNMQMLMPMLLPGMKDHECVPIPYIHETLTEYSDDNILYIPFGTAPVVGITDHAMPWLFQGIPPPF